VFLTDERKAVLRALRHGPLDLYELATETAIAPFTVRAILQGLRRELLVSERYTLRAREFELTTRGAALVWSHYQTRFWE
jgi:DNA-binding IclR family transcriptional regulator